MGEDATFTKIPQKYLLILSFNFIFANKLQKWLMKKRSDYSDYDANAKISGSVVVILPALFLLKSFLNYY